VELAALLGLSWSLLALAVIDIDTQLLPDDITLPLLWAGLLYHLFFGDVAMADAVLGAAGGYLLLWSVYWLFRWSRARKAWASVTSSCWRRSAPGWAGRACP
jgi:leader peptidase (prepilin peptidase)/N-methyltransferase